MDAKAKIRKYLRSRIAWHLSEVKKMREAPCPNIPAIQWEGGYIDALRRVLDYTGTIRHSGVGTK